MRAARWPTWTCPGTSASSSICVVSIARCPTTSASMRSPRCRTPSTPASPRSGVATRTRCATRPSALSRLTGTWCCRGRVHSILMRLNEAARGLLGEHDFTAFCKPAGLRVDDPRDPGADTGHAGADGLCVMSIRADAFCHSMVRSLVGVMLPVGDGRRSSYVAGSGARVPAPGIRPSPSCRPSPRARGGRLPQRGSAARSTGADPNLPGARRHSAGRVLTWVTSTFARQLLTVRTGARCSTT